MRKGGIDVLLIFSHAFNDYGNTCYVSNYVIRGPRATLVMIPQKGKVVLFFEGASRGLPFMKATTWVEDIRACGDVSQECLKYMQEEALIPSTIGMVGLRQFMPQYQYTFLTEALSQSTLVNGEHIIQDMRMLKSVRERDQIRRSSRIVKHIFDFVTSTSFPILNERVFDAQIYREARLEGAEDVRVLFGKPQDAEWALRPAEDAVIAPEQVIILFVAVEYERYWAEGIRTFKAKDAFFVDAIGENVETLYERIISNMKPGKLLSQCYKEAMGEIQKSTVEYIPNYGLGQGIGLSLQELPMITATERAQLQAGMCLTLRLTIKDKAMGALMIGNTFCVSQNEVELLTR